MVELLSSGGGVRFFHVGVCSLGVCELGGGLKVPKIMVGEYCSFSELNGK